MSNLKPIARASARIRQLAALDISGPQLAPLLLQELRVLLPFEIGIYTHTAADGSYHYFVDEAHAAKQLTPQSVDPRYVVLENEVLRSAADSVFYEFGPTPMAEQLRVPRSEFLQHPFYTEALRPAGGDDGVRFLPRQRNGQPVGRLLLGRDSRKHHGQVISRVDLQPMARVQHWIAHALEPRPATPTLEYDSREAALLVVGGDLRLQHLSPNAERLITLAFGNRWRYHGAIPEELLRMLRSIRQIDHAEPPTHPPALDKISPWGRFNFRAYILDATPENAMEQISTSNHVIAYGITVTHAVPVALRLIEAVRRTQLTSRQTEICYWLARGESHREIAARCSISINTAIYHSRQIYAKFNASNRNELVASLFASSKARL